MGITASLIGPVNFGTMKLSRKSPERQANRLGVSRMIAASSLMRPMSAPREPKCWSESRVIPIGFFVSKASVAFPLEFSLAISLGV
uniref:Uncharacterized protein n=1 Tax=uncultured marine virus TaxID=186617 RepID=A0A0F7L747_9VIRU|nr:hypothetical protein [uncultured marine virus]